MHKQIKIQCFLHASFEGPGIIADWVIKNNHLLEYTRFYEGDSLPEASDIDLLVILGGPMNVYDYHIHSWMQEEVEWVSKYINSGKPVLGICLGAQIIAAALGAEVYPGEHKEIGWFNLQFLPALGDFMIWKDLPATRKVFHWHGDTFPIPKDAIRIASSLAYPNQGFIYNRKVLALQFHLEVTPDSVSDLVKNCKDELVPGPYVQPVSALLAEEKNYPANQELMFQLLNYLSGLIS